MTRFGSALVLLVCVSSLPRLASGDWPTWCGSRGNCSTQPDGLLDKWPEGGPKELWRQPVGQGFASPVAVAGKVYAFGTIDGKDTLVCFNAADGKTLWSQKSDVGYTGGHPGTRATPTIEGGRIYTFGGLGDLICRELADGKQVWKLDVLKATGAKMLMWGCASCPMILGERAYVQVGDGPVAIAVNKKTGQIAWKSDEKKGSYAAVVAIEVGGGTQVVAIGGKAAVGLDPATGKTLWTQPWPTTYDINAVSPIYRDGHLFVTSGYGIGCAMYKFDGKTAELLWQKKEPHDRMVPPLLEGDSLYVTNEGSLMCLSWPAGEVRWEKDFKLGLGGQYVRYGDKMIMLGDTGQLLLVHATPKECKLISQVQAFTGKEIWASPIVDGGKLYVKGPSELVCYDIGTK